MTFTKNQGQLDFDVLKPPVIADIINEE